MSSDQKLQKKIRPKVGILILNTNKNLKNN